jgi:hypothetical protein
MVVDGCGDAELFVAVGVDDTFNAICTALDEISGYGAGYIG